MPQSQAMEKQRYVVLDGTKIPIEGEVELAPVTPWTARFSTGPPKYEDYAPTSHQTWEALKGGWGLERWKQGQSDRIHYGTLDTAGNLIVLPPLVSSLGLATRGLIRKIIEFKGAVFAFADGQTAYYDGSDWIECGQVIIENCEDAWNESTDEDVTSELDAVDYKVGSGSVKLTVADGCDAGDILATEVIDLTGVSGVENVHLWIKSSVALDANDLQILLSASANCASPAEELNIPAIAADTWTQVNLATTSAVSATYKSVGVKMVVDKGAFILRLDDLRAAAQHPYDAVVYYDPTAADRYLCVGTQGGAIWTTASATGLSWTKAHTSGTWLTIFRKRLVALGYQYDGFHYSDEGDLSTFTDEATFPNVPFLFNKFYTGKNVAGEDTLYFTTNDGRYYIDFDTLSFGKTEMTWSPRADGGLACLYWKGNHYVGTGKGLLELSGNVVTAIGPDLDDGLLSTYQGSVVDIIGLDYWLILVLEKVILKRHISGGGWHFLAAPTAAFRGWWYSDYLYYNDWTAGTTDYVRRIHVPDEADNVAQVATHPYAASGEMFLPYFDAGIVGFSKLALRVWALTQDCNENETITISYRTDATAGWTELGSFESSPRPTALPFPKTGDAVGVEFNRIQFKVAMARRTTGDTPTVYSPKLEALAFEYLPLPPPLRGFQFRANCDSRAAKRIGISTRGKDLIDKLWTVYGQAAMVTFYPDGDPTSGTKYIVKMVTLPGREGGGYGGREGIYQVNVSEVVDT